MNKQKGIEKQMKHNNSRRWPLMLSLLLIVLLAACGANVEEPAADSVTPDEGDVAAPVTVDMGEVEVDDEAAPEGTPQEMPSPGIPDPETAMTERVRAELSERLGVDLDSIEVESVEATEWSDTALGCPDPDQMYAQVITPGFEINLTVDGESYSYHTDMGGAMVLCDDEGQPVSEGLQSVSPVVVDLQQITPEAPDPDAEPRVAPAPGIPNPSVAASQRAAIDLADSLKIDLADVEILSIEQVEWSDSSLGCPKPGRSYATVITPGFRVLLEADGEQIEYHTNLDGTALAQCEGGATNPTNTVDR